MASVPGITALSKYGTTLGEILGFDGTSFNPERVNIFRIYVLDRFQTLLRGEEYADPIKLFIKQEPHKKTKIKDMRLRLISAVSVVDTMIDRMLFQDIFQSFVENPLRTPVAIGWNPLNLGASFLRNKIGAPTFDTDKKHWDWTFPHWLLFDSYIILTSLTNFPFWWHRVARLRFKMLFEQAIFSFPDGTLVRQQGHGIMKSGCYLTLLLNSLGQWLLHTLCENALGVKVPMVCFGDDVTQKSTSKDKDFVSYYESLGFTVESCKHEDMEFCGFHIYTRNRFLPAYKGKHIFALSHLTLEEQTAIQTLQSYQYLYWFDKPFLKLIRQVAVNRGLSAALVDDDQIMRVVYGR